MSERGVLSLCLFATRRRQGTGFAASLILQDGCLSRITKLIPYSGFSERVSNRRTLIVGSFSVV